MTDIRSLEQTLLENLPWNRARIKLVARFLLALYAVQTVNLSMLATALAGHAQIESNYKRLQDRKSTRLNSSHIQKSRMPSSA